MKKPGFLAQVIPFNSEESIPLSIPQREVLLNTVSATLHEQQGDLAFTGHPSPRDHLLFEK